VYNGRVLQWPTVDLEEPPRERILFVCTANQDRSPTAERLYREDPRYEVRSAGVAPFANTRLTLDLLLWADGIARTMGLDVEVTEPDVSPLAVQGPRSDDVMARVFGDEVRDIKFFRFRPLAFSGHEMFVARTGWSAQGGFEIYVDDAEIGGLLWDEVMSAGAEFDIRPGCPNLIERIEAGSLTYGTDMTREHTALEAGLDKYCSLDAPIETIGMDALRRQRAEGVTRRLCGFVVDGDRVPLPRDAWPVAVGGTEVGSVTSAVWSPRLHCNVALGMMPIHLTAVGTEITLIAPDGERSGRVSEVPFPGAVQR